MIKKLLLALLLFSTPLAAQQSARMIAGVRVIPNGTTTFCPYTIQPIDVVYLADFTSACTVTLPTGGTAGYGKGSIFSVKNDSIVTITITTSGGALINGQASYDIPPTTGADIYSDGTNYKVQPGKGTPQPPLGSLQYNSNGAFGGSIWNYDPIPGRIWGGASTIIYPDYIYSRSFISSTLPHASTGTMQLGGVDVINWRNFANSGDVVLGKNTSDQLTLQGNPIPSFSAAITGGKCLHTVGTSGTIQETGTDCGAGGGGGPTLQTNGTPNTSQTVLNLKNGTGTSLSADGVGGVTFNVTQGANYQTMQNNGSALPAEPILDCIAPMLCADDPGNTRTDISTPVAVGVGVSHATGLVPDPGASGTSTDYLGRDMAYHTSAAAGTILPDPSTGIQYVTVTCNGGVACSDSNDGLSWGSAKATPYAALLALPNGATSPPTAGNGIVYVSNSVAGIPFGGPVAGGHGGWWMFGATDPNFAAGKTGWMRQPITGQVTLECASPKVGVIHETGSLCTEFWGGHTDNQQPPFWFNATSGAQVLRGFGFAYEATGGKIGIDSNGNRSAGISSVYLDQIGQNFGNCYSGIGAGPGLDIGGNSFWISITHSSFSGCSAAGAYYITAISRTSNVVTVTLDRSATGDIVVDGHEKIIIRNVTNPIFNGAYIITSASGSSVTFAQTGLDGSSSGGQAFVYGAAAIGVNSGSYTGSGFIYADDVSLNNGGVWLQGGYNGVGFSGNKLNYEGDFTHPDMSIVEVLPPSTVGDTAVYVDDVQIADNLVPICGVENFAAPGYISAKNATVCGAIATNGAQNGNGLNGVGALRQGIQGVYNYKFFAGNIDAGRRMFSPYAVRFPNLLGDSSTWTTSGGMTLTTGQTAPDGTSGAVLATNSTGSQQTLSFGGIGPPGALPEIGSSYLFGVWVKNASNATANLTFVLNSSGLGTGSYCQGSYYSGQAGGGKIAQIGSAADGTGQWNWISGICKIVANGGGGGGGYQYLFAYVPTGYAPTFYGPVLSLAPNGAISDDEAWQLVNNMQSYPKNAVAGDITALDGQRLSIASMGFRNGGFVTTINSATLAASHTVTVPDPLAAAVLPLLTGAITGTKCLHTVGTTGIIQEAAADCGSGGGTTVAATQFSGPYYSAAGTASTINGFAAPTTNGFWQYGWNVTAGVAVIPSKYLVGMGHRAITGAATTDTVLYSDNGTTVIHDVAGSAGVTVTLPTATTLGNAAFVFSYTNHSASTDTITPTTWTIQDGASAAGASVSVATGITCRIQVDPNSATNWISDCSRVNANATSVNGAAVPASKPVLASNGSSQLIAATGHNIVTPLVCLDTSGSGTAQSCTTTPSFTPAAGDTIIYSTTTTNTGDVTVNVDSSSAVHVRKNQGGALVVLAAGDLLLNTYPILTYDGTYWEYPATAKNVTTIASGTQALNTASIASASCDTVVTATATGVVTTDVVSFGLNGDISGVTGYVPSTNGTLYIYAYPGSGTVSFKVCNNTAGAITPGAVSVNWRVSR